MNIYLRTIPHEHQRYPTVGDWMVEDSGNLTVRISDMGNDDYSFLVALHELIEARLCMNRGISQQNVDDFDRAFEANREDGNVDEPGDDPEAPYRREHFFATSIERLMAAELGVDWQTYEAAVSALP